eukprot:963876-Prymnesium_polylepis.1
MNTNPSPRPPSSPPQHMPPCAGEPHLGGQQARIAHGNNRSSRPVVWPDRLSLRSRRNTADQGRTCTSVGR